MEENEQSAQTTPQNYGQRGERQRLIRTICGKSSNYNLLSFIAAGEPCVATYSVLQSQALCNVMTFSPDFLDIPTMLFFFLHELMSFLRAKNSQMSWRKIGKEKRTLNFTVLHLQQVWAAMFLHSFFVCLFVFLSPRCCIIIPAELWWVQSALTGRGWSPPKFL